MAAPIADNPVRAGMCDAAHEWAWSSHAAIAGGERPRWLDADRLFVLLTSAAGGDPRRRDVELMADHVPEPVTSPFKRAVLAELHEPASPTELARRLGCTRHRATHHLRDLERHGLVVRVGRGRYRVAYATAARTAATTSEACSGVV